MYILSHSDCLSISLDFAAFNVFFTSGNYPDPIEEIGKVNVIISKTGNFSTSSYFSPTISDTIKSNLVEKAVAHCRERFYLTTKRDWRKKKACRNSDFPFSVRFLYYYIYYFILFKPQNFIPSPYKRRIVKVCSYKLYFFSNRARTTTPSTSSATSIIPPAIFSSFWSSQHFAAGIINFCCSKIISPLYV